MKKVYLIGLFILAAIMTQAQSLTLQAPSSVQTGEQFRVSYTVNTNKASGFRVGDFPSALEVLMGPSKSEQSSFRMVNGHMSSSSSITYTFIISANEPGTFTIPSAHVTVEGNTVKSATAKITVGGKAQSSQQNQNQRQNGGQQQQQLPQAKVKAAGSPISSNELFIKVSANKQRVHEQEPVLLSYKVYTLVDLTQLRGNMPDLKGFHTQEIPLPQQKSFHVETLNGRPYRCVTWSQYVMYPQMTGKLEIPSITFDGVVVQQNRNVDPFEAFFNGGSGYVEVNKQIRAPGLTIQVDPLPAKPANFSGGVGHFNISAQLDKTEVKANDPVSIRIIVSGDGNLKLIKQPVVNLPKDFDKYDAKVTDKTRLTTKGTEGNMIYDILAVPRHQGTFEIPPIEFVYYDTSSNSYKTLKTQSFTLNVLKGEGGGSMKDFSGEDVKLLNNDIRHIKSGNDAKKIGDETYFGSQRYLITLGILLLAFIALLVIFRKRAAENANLSKKRGKKANKVATKRLKHASQLMIQNRKNEFYDEVLRTLWGYVGDKLNMPVEQLSKDNISDKLKERGVSDDNVTLFLEAINDCEYARYAPGDSTGNMEKVFSKAMDAITNVDNQIGKTRKASSATMLLLLLLMLPISLSAADKQQYTKADGDSAYAKENYQKAVTIYEQLLKKEVSPELYYNLGNAYYRTDNITKAVLNYERALLLSPGDKDIRYNLQLARSKTIDKITPESEMFFVTWYHSLVNMMSVDGWANTAVVCLFLALLLALVYLFANSVTVRKIGFFGGLLMLAVFILSNIMAYQQKRELVDRDGGIVTASSVTVKSTPSDSGTDLFVIHEGTKVTVTDGSMKGWKEIRIADGKSGWIPTDKIEMI